MCNKPNSFTNMVLAFRNKNSINQIEQAQISQLLNYQTRFCFDLSMRQHICWASHLLEIIGKRNNNSTTIFLMQYVFKSIHAKKNTWIFFFFESFLYITVYRTVQGTNGDHITCTVYFTSSVNANSADRSQNIPKLRSRSLWWGWVRKKDDSSMLLFIQHIWFSFSIQNWENLSISHFI